ncbi:type VI secretion system lipoprotein TssJ [Niveibacterium sp. SC-1]|uniref:type VI secretion system lipoprotein TssJ n=1 Tax=Niveibacterium sp. SC-1 TaxID=3135646 RepID=UPI00311FFF79
MKSAVQKWLCALVVLAVLSGCGGKAPIILPPSPTVVRLHLAADAQINPDTKGRPTPVVVRYYLLSNPGVFESADFFSLFDGDEKTLGATLVSREEVTLRPGQTLDAELKPQAEAKAIGVFVAYRDVNKSVWRASAAVPQNKTTNFSVAVKKDRVTIGSEAK